MSEIEPEIENQIKHFGEQILRESNKNGGLFEKAADSLMEWGMQDEKLKVSLFRFVDVLPSLKNSETVLKYIHEYFNPIKDILPYPLRKGLDVQPNSILAPLASKAIRFQVGIMAGRFILGLNPKVAIKKLKKLRSEGLAFTVDLLGEATLSEDEASKYVELYHELIILLSEKFKGSKPLIAGHLGELSSVNVSVKLSALYSKAKPLNHIGSVERLTERVSKLVRAAVANGAYLYIDMEDSTLTDITLEVYKNIGLQFPNFKQFGIVLQAYMKRTEGDLIELARWGREHNRKVGIRLVKGAYWDTETIYSNMKGWENPVFTTKADTDANYEKLSNYLLSEIDVFYPAFASHNVRSLSNAVMTAEALKIPKTHFELQMLYGMAGPIKEAFKKRGYLIRDYAPVGDLVPGMGYLVRRLLENTSNEGWLRKKFFSEAGFDELLKKPEYKTEATEKLEVDPNLKDKFKNIPPTDFSLKIEREKWHSEISQLQQAINVRPIIGGEEILKGEIQRNTSPEDFDFTVSKVIFADLELTKKTIERLNSFFPTWSTYNIETRSKILLKTADLLFEERYRLGAIIVKESAKPIIEADGDIGEAIDFLRFYAHEALKLFKTEKLTFIDGETNHLLYEPRGVTSVIAPWNFPLAIPCGMFAASLVTGNCTILKPAEQSSLIAYELFKLFIKAGLPPEAAAFLPGKGEVIGPELTNNPAISTVVFTGSKDVGLAIIASSAKTNGTHVRRVIAEMGGKNAIIVDEGADYDEAIKGIVQSAFGFSGQKCSACSRLILVGEAFEALLPRLKESILSLNIGRATDFATEVGPVIDQEAQLRINQTIEAAKKRGVEFFESRFKNNLDGSYVTPTAFYNLDRSDPIWQDEIFGPVIGVIKTKNFEEGLKFANESVYGLTGGVFSRNPRSVELAQREFKVGNLYINRPCTGALVQRQPFGGAKMSGVGSKAGGVEYLKQFVYPRVVTENTVRRGFAPSEE